MLPSIKLLLHHHFVPAFEFLTHLLEVMISLEACCVCRVVIITRHSLERHLRQEGRRLVPAKGAGFRLQACFCRGRHRVGCDQCVTNPRMHLFVQPWRNGLICVWSHSHADLQGHTNVVKLQQTVSHHRQMTFSDCGSLRSHWKLSRDLALMILVKHALSLCDLGPSESDLTPHTSPILSTVNLEDLT